jgi:hypothetical protein
MACVSITSTSASRSTTVSPPATGETSFPGASWHHSSRPAGPYYGPVFAKAFPGGHRRCLFSVSHFSTSSPSGPALSGAAVPYWGDKLLHLSFGGSRFSWSFLLAAVQFPIIGVDFLRNFGLLVDPAANQLVDHHTLHVFQSSTDTSSVSVSASILRPPAHQLEEPSLSSTPPPVASAASHVNVPSGSCEAHVEAAHRGLRWAS